MEVKHWVISLCLCGIWCNWPWILQILCFMIIVQLSTESAYVEELKQKLLVPQLGLLRGGLILHFRRLFVLVLFSLCILNHHGLVNSLGMVHFSYLLQLHWLIFFFWINCLVFMSIKFSCLAGANWDILSKVKKTKGKAIFSSKHHQATSIFFCLGTFMFWFLFLFFVAAPDFLLFKL